MSMVRAHTPLKKYNTKGVEEEPIKLSSTARSSTNVKAKYMATSCKIVLLNLTSLFKILRNFKIRLLEKA